MKIFQIGAAGGVGRRLSALLSARGDQATGMHRAAAQADTIREAGAVPVVGDLIGDSVGQLAAKLSGHDAVVVSAGAHGTGQALTTQIDGRGLEKAGVTRFVLVSAFPEAGRGDALGDGFEHSPWTG